MAYTEADLWKAVDRLVHTHPEWAHEQRVTAAKLELAGRDIAAGQRPDTRPIVGDKNPVTPTTPDKPKPRDFYSEARLLMPFIPDALLKVYAGAWEKYGDPTLALQVMRQDGTYDQFFAGNRRPDGTVILPEGEYLSTKEGYRRELAALGLDPARYEERLTQAIVGGKSVDEFTDDITSIAAEIGAQSDNIRAFYAQNYGTGDLSFESLIDSRLTGESPLVYERRIRSAQIGGEAAGYGFGLAKSQAERLEMLGLDQQAARGLFASAQRDLPTLNELLARHNDPDNEFTLDEYSNAVVLKDANQLAQIRRLQASDSALWSQPGMSVLDRAGGAVGLRSR